MKLQSIGSSVTAGLDVGYGSLKLVAGAVGGPTEHEVLLPAGALPARLAPKVSGVADLKGGEEVLIERSSEAESEASGEAFEQWIAGIEPAEVPRIVRQLNETYPLTNEYLALYRAGLARSRASRIDLLVTGLPTNQYYDPRSTELKQRMIARMQGVHRINATTTVEVKQVSVIPQPLGAFMSVACMPRHKDLLKGATPTLVIDPGFFSLDFVTLSGRAINEKTSGSYMLATSKILEEAAQAMTLEFDRPITRDDLDRALRRGEREVSLSYTRTAAFGPFVAKAARAVSEEAVSKMRSDLRDHGRVDLVILTGGGASLYEEAVRSAWHGADIEVVTDPCFGNARGYRASAEIAMAARGSARAA